MLTFLIVSLPRLFMPFFEVLSPGRYTNDPRRSIIRFAVLDDNSGNISIRLSMSDSEQLMSAEFAGEISFSGYRLRVCGRDSIH